MNIISKLVIFVQGASPKKVLLKRIKPLPPPIRRENLLHMENRPHIKRKKLSYSFFSKGGEGRECLLLPLLVGTHDFESVA